MKHNKEEKEKGKRSKNRKSTIELNLDVTPHGIDNGSYIPNN